MGSTFSSSDKAWLPMCAVQTKAETNAHVVLMDAMKDLKTEIKDLDAAFEAAVATFKDKSKAGAMDY